MFGIDPDTIKNLALLQQQIKAFMLATNVALEKIEAQLNRIEAKQTGVKEND